MATNLVKIGNIYYFRQRIPVDLCHIFNTTEVKHSLHATTRRAAYLMFTQYIQFYSVLFQSVRFHHLPPKINKRAIELWLKLNPGKAFIPPELLQQNRITRFATGDYTGLPSVTSPYIIQTLLDYGYIPDEEGKFDLTQPPQLDVSLPVSPSIPTAKPKTPPSHLKKTTLHLNLDKAIEQYLEYKITSNMSQNKLQNSSVSQYKSALNRFRVWLGSDCTIQSAADRASDFLHYEYNCTELKGKGRKNKRIVLNGFFNKWALPNNLISKTIDLPTVVIPKSETENTGNKQYTIEQLNNLLTHIAIPNGLVSKKYPHRHIYSGFFILLALLTGARKEELHQLTPADIKIYNGTLCFTLFGKNTKNLQSKRAIPLHTALIDIGLLEYTAKLQPNEKLFPCGTETIREDLNEAKRKSKISCLAYQYTFHSFRGGLISRLNDYDCPDTIRNSITGHSNKDMMKIYDEFTEERLPLMKYYIDKTYKNLNFTTLKTNLAKALKEFNP